MHELAVAEQIVAAAVEAAGGAGEREIVSVHVTMGAAGHLDAGILADAFSIAAAGTVAAAATLEIEPGTEMAVTAISVR